MDNREVISGREEIAVIGMAGRFPGARDLDQFWENLCQGVEATRAFSGEELAASGVNPDVLKEPGYVNAGIVLEEAECFDAEFFGCHPREAEIMDPQHRIFLECAWAALEDAGYDPERYAGLVGVFGGVARNTYLLHNLAPRRDLVETLASHPVVIANDKDFPATRVSFKLNLRGPSLNVQTACSSSGVAIHLACQSLLGGECDLALAGGARIRVPMRAGYFYEEGGIQSPDGHCRAFDAQARGTVLGSGAALVVLKRLSEALRDGDSIRALIKGSAINNDGAAKVGFTAPSVSGQARVIAEAQAVAGVEAGTIGYVEAHGTGTSLGDPIEIAALTQAFRRSTDRKTFCALGSLKPNIGHLDAGAGAAGLIKTVLALEHQCLPPSVNFERPNPQIDFANSPFYVNNRLAEWPAGPTPRRAAVSSFGLGGTNAHIILEEAPALAPSGPSRPGQLLLLSGKTRAALDRATADLAAFLERHPEASLPDAAYTLQVGRRAFHHRRMLVCSDRVDALEALRHPGSPRLVTKQTERQEPPVVFMFPGQGAQEVNMGAGLFRAEPVFREAVDRCAEALQPHLGLDLRDVLYPAAPQLEAARRQLSQTLLAQPALFTVEYAFARLWMEWGVQPAAMIGHSIGEYVAACLADVFSVEDALALLAARGRLMQALPGGVMLAVHLAEAEARQFLGPALSLAAVNAASRCVLSGPSEAIAAVEAQLAARQVACRRLQTSHAFHSAMMDPVLAPFAEQVAQVRLNPPRIPFISSVTGAWITPAEATDPAYWARHLRSTVRFADGLQEILRGRERLLLEAGPGEVLSGLARQAGRDASAPRVFASSASSQAGHDDTTLLLNTLGQLWLAGVPVNWTEFSRHERRRRIALPTYPFERKRYWIDPPRLASAPTSAPPAARECPRALTAEEPPRSLTAVVTVPAPANGNGHGHSADRPARIVEELKSIIHELSGTDLAGVNPEATFLGLGFDSLFLTQAGMSFQKKFGVPITLRHLMDEHPSLRSLAGYIDAQLLADAPADLAPAPAMAVVEAPDRVAPSLTAEASGGHSTIERIINQQLAIMTEQLAVLRAAPAHEASLLAAKVPPTRTVSTQTPSEEKASSAARPAPASTRATPNADSKAFGPFKPIEKGRHRPLSAAQQKALDELIARYTRRTGESKRLTQRHRPHLADPRSVSGFRLDWKEMVYPVVVARAAGSRLWDVDGNEYIDFTMGFGLNLFGHSPEFVTRAVAEQLQQGFPIGPQSPLAGEVAEAMREFSGLDRVTFCNTGSEAVLAALRVARTVTGRQRVALFAGSYHGINDEVLGRPNPSAPAGRPLPIAPGLLPSALENVLVLDYGQPAAFEILKAHAGELAAVLVEPVQSRRPDLQPRKFLHAVRELTLETGAAMIFDEVVTGFRLHQRGAQAWYGVPADLATYGKVLGGGLPMGLVTGKSRFMDAFDGGPWQYGDESIPGVGVTFFAGTFVRHPLALAAAAATLRQVRERGPGLQEQLNARGSRLAKALAEHFAEHRIPIRVLNCGSMFHFVFEEDHGWARLLYYHLRLKGIHVLEGRPCFLSTAHSKEDIERILRAFQESVLEMKKSGFFSAGRAPAGVSAAVPPLAGDDQSREPARLPLTPAQMEIWLEAQKGDAASCRYNESNSLRLRGDLDVEAMRRALQSLVARHEALRTVFSPAGDAQEIQPVMALEIPLLDLSELEPGRREMRIAELQQREGTLPFDLARGPLLRAQLLRLEPRVHLLLLTQHHLIVDGWSLAILLKELGELYSAAVQGAEASLVQPMRFSEYAEWRTGPESQAATAQAEAYWLNQYADSTPVLELPADHRRALKSGRSARVIHRIPAAVYESLKRLSAGRNASLFAALLAGFELWLHRLSGQDDVVVGTPAANQPLAEGRGLVGHCTHLLPVRSQFEGAQSFAAFLALTKRKLADAMDHQSCTFGTLVRQLRLPRDPHRVPLVSVTFNLDRPVAGLAFAGLEVEITPNPKQYINFDLSLNARDTGHDLKLECDFDTGLFEAETIQRWLGHWGTLLAGLAADPEQTLGSAPLLTAEERRQILVKWNDTRTDYPREKSVAQLFEEQAGRTPDQVAVVFGQRSLTYQELNRRANQLAHHLRRRGVEPGVNVGLFLERSADLIVGLVAILKAGGVYVPLDPSYPAERIAFMLEDTQSPVILTQDSLRPRLGSLQPPADALCLDTSWETIAQESAANPPVCATGEHLAYIIYTSGSTGKPKGVSVPHRAISRLLCHTNYIQLEPSDRVAQVSSSSFDAATFEIWGALLHGATLVGIDQDIALSPPEFAATLDEARITTLFLTTALFNQIAAEAPGAFRTLKHLLFGGEAVDPTSVRTVLEQGRPQRLLHVYGPTESTTFASWHEVKAVPSTAGTVPIGRPLANTQLFVLDRHQQPAPVGVPGELYIGGDGLALDYYHRPELTAERFVAHPFETGARLYRTGDLVRWLAGGNLEFLGRLDHQVKLRGFRIELEEIETLLKRHEAVRDAIVMVREDRAGDKRLAAYLILKERTAAPPAAGWREFLKPKLPDYMVPAAFVVLDSFPLTPHGKVDRAALPAPGPARPEPKPQPGTPGDPTERQLTEIWEAVLGLQRIGIDDTFFDLGGHSLLAVRLFAEIERRFGRRLRQGSLFEAPTIRQLAALLRPSEPPRAKSSAVAIQPGGSRPPLFLVHGAGGGILWGYAKLAQYLGADQPVYGLEAGGAAGAEEFTPLEAMAAQYLADARKLQPSGPYYLGGYCFGGDVAFEMACQLHAQGERVALLALIDSTPPGFDQAPIQWWHPRFVPALVRNIRVALLDFSNFTPGEQRDSLRRKLRILKKKLARFSVRAARTENPLDLEDVINTTQFSESEIKLWERHLRALRAYVPKPYAGRVTLFRTRRQPLGCVDPTLGWGKLVAEAVAVQLIPGSHENIFLEPHVESLARQIQAALNPAALFDRRLHHRS